MCKTIRINEAISFSCYPVRNSHIAWEIFMTDQDSLIIRGSSSSTDTQSGLLSSFKASSKRQMQLFKYVCLFSYLRKIAKCFASCISSVTFFLSIVLLSSFYPLPVAKERVVSYSLTSTNFPFLS